MEIKKSNFARARSLLDKARIKIQKSPELSRLAVYLEIEAQNKKAAIYNLAKALKEFPNDGEMNSIAIGIVDILFFKI